MSTAYNELISQKFNNYNYAPGIATYGIDGKTGEAGNNGNNVFFTDCDITNGDTSDLTLLFSLIKNNKMPLKNTDITLIRKYQNGDIFFNRNGIVFKLIDIDKIIGEGSNPGNLYSTYFEICGKIDIDKIVDNQDRNIFDFSPSGRMVLNSSYYNGFDIIIGLTETNTNINENSTVNIISNNINQDDNIELVNMQCIDETDIDDGRLSLYYKTTENAFHLDSEQAVVIDGDLKVNNTNNTDNEYDNYSTVLTSDDTITYFKHICDKLRYNITYDDKEDGQYKIVIYSSETELDNQLKTLDYLIHRNETVFGKIYTLENEQILIKLSDIIFGNNSIDSFNNYLPMYNVLDLNPSISKKSGFNIEFVNVKDSSLYINKSENNQNKSISIDVSLNVNLLDKHIIAGGTAASSSTFMDIIENEDPIIIDKQYKDQNAPYGIALGETINKNKYIVITPNDPIYAGDRLDISIYTTTSVSELKASIWVDGVLYDTPSITDPEVSGEKSTKYIYSSTYTFDHDVHNNIRIGFPNKNFRLHKYSIIANSEKHTQYETTSIQQSTQYYEKRLTDAVLGIRVSYDKNDNYYKFSGDNIEVDTMNNIKTSCIYNKTGRYNFVFNTNNIKTINNTKNILLDIIPCIDYYGDIPAQIKFTLPNNLNGLYSLCFTIVHSESKFSIQNIMLDDKNAPEILQDDQMMYYIQAYLPDSVDSVQKFALLHNTEVFLQYED